MLEFVVIILPGIIFAYAAEWLMKRRLGAHYFLFLSAFNVLVLNFSTLKLCDFMTEFLSADGYVLAVGSMQYATTLLKQIICVAVVGIPLCLVEAFIGRFISVSLDDTKKEKEEKEKNE